MGSAARIQHLLANGALHLARDRTAPGTAPDTAPDHRAAPTWSYRELRGRVVELCGEGATALLTVATGLVLEAQRQREPVAWITDPAATVYPPDLAENGIDLSALLFVKLATARDMLRATDQVLRSGAFGLVVLDLPSRLDVPMAVQVRLLGLARKHDAVLVLVCLGTTTGNSLASLRAVSRRRRSGGGRFGGQLTIQKDKRRGREWHHEQTFDAAVGLR